MYILKLAPSLVSSKSLLSQNYSLVTLSLIKSYNGDVPRYCMQTYHCSGLWNKDLSNRRNFGCPHPGLWQSNQHHRHQQWSLCKQIVKVSNLTKVLIYESQIVNIQIAALHILHSLRSKHLSSICFKELCYKRLNQEKYRQVLKKLFYQKRATS